jgi:NADP-dependent 3-hydroxy acid dehydrogenase YdfG
MTRFAGKRILVVGASAGIGAGVARRLAAEGAEVHLAARRRERLDEHVAMIRAAQGKAIAHACDIASSADVAKLFGELAGQGRVLDAVVNTAAVLWFEPFAPQLESRWRAMLDTNLAGAICLTQHALNHMLPRCRGHIVHVTSTAARLAIPQLAIYSTTKAALAHFLAALRGEYGKSGVRFTELEIGNTAGTEGGGAREMASSEDVIRIAQRWTGAPEMMQIDDVADAVLFALSTSERTRLDRIVLRELAEIPT